MIAASQPRLPRSRVLAMALLLLLFALLTAGARLNSLTADEPAYIAGGYVVWARGTEEALQLLARRGYPPLLAAAEALPLYLGDPGIDVETLAGWPGDFDALTRSFRQLLVPPKPTLLATRMATILLTVLLGAVVFRWGADLAGSVAGLLALTFMVFDPTMLAHGRLAHTDAGATALGTLALFLAWRWSSTPTWSLVIATGVVLALTLLAKVSGPLWLIAALVIVAATAVEGRGQGQARRLLIQGGAMVATALLIWWAAYGFSWGRVPGLPVSVPAPAYWEAARYLQDYVTDVYALGLRQTGRWWWYFPVAFLLKNPLPLLIAFGAGLAVLVRRRLSLTQAVALAVFPLSYSLVAILDGMNIGYRHMLPVHPFLYLVAGSGLALWAWSPAARPWRRWATAGLGLWAAVAVLAVFPWELAYFNELAGGPRRGYRYLADSNTDWGQADGLRAALLAAYPDINPVAPAEAYSPQPGRYLISAAQLQGTGIGDVYAYEWFRHREPVRILGYSKLLFEVPTQQPRWLAQCSKPWAPLQDPWLQQGIAQTDLRRLEFDCTQSWIYPSGGADPGLYGLQYDLLRPQRLCLPDLLPCPPQAQDPFVQQHLASARLSYEQPEDGQLPAFALFQASPGQPMPVPDGSATPRLDGPLAFLGASATLRAGTIDVSTWWQATAGPVDRPFSIMGHLLSAEGQVLEVIDGLGISPLTLQPGDVLVQRARFQRPAEARGLKLETGAYWLDPLQRWPVLDPAAGDSIVIPLDEILQDDERRPFAGPS